MATPHMAINIVFEIRKNCATCAYGQIGLEHILEISRRSPAVTRPTKTIKKHRKLLDSEITQGSPAVPRDFVRDSQGLDIVRGLTVMGYGSWLMARGLWRKGHGSLPIRGT